MIQDLGVNVFIETDNGFLEVCMVRVQSKPKDQQYAMDYDGTYYFNRRQLTEPLNVHYLTDANGLPEVRIVRVNLTKDWKGMRVWR